MYSFTLRRIRQMLFAICLCCIVLAAKEKKKHQQPVAISPIDRLLASPDTILTNSTNGASPGSTFFGGAPFLDLASDVRARNVGDLVTVVVLDQASATSQGTTSSQRTSSANYSISSLFGPKSPHNALNNLLKTNGQTQLAGQGATTRQTTVSTTVSTRVLGVLPNGDLIVEGSKLISINSEFQTVSLRGIVRQTDLGQSDSVGSNQVEDLEVRINGRGVVADAIHRPNFLYRLFLGILPF